MKHGVEEASATVRRCHTFGREEAIWSLLVSKEAFVDLGRELLVPTACRRRRGCPEDEEVSRLTNLEQSSA
jgi:hypothetical protein